MPSGLREEQIENCKWRNCSLVGEETLFPGLARSKIRMHRRIAKIGGGGTLA